MIDDHRPRARHRRPWISRQHSPTSRSPCAAPPGPCHRPPLEARAAPAAVQEVIVRRGRGRHGQLAAAASFPAPEGAPDHRQPPPARRAAARLPGRADHHPGAAVTMSMSIIILSGKN